MSILRDHYAHWGVYRVEAHPCSRLVLLALTGWSDG